MEVCMEMFSNIVLPLRLYPSLKGEFHPLGSVWNVGRFSSSKLVLRDIVLSWMKKRAAHQTRKTSTVFELECIF